MLYWLDEEFIDTGSTIDLISIGIVAEDGRELYAQSVEFDHRKASDWVKENVLVHLQSCRWASVTHVDSRNGYVNELNYHQGHGQCVDKTRWYTPDCPWRLRSQIKRDLHIFFDQGDSIELWGWCSSYDFVAFCQLFGTMMDLPSGFPHYIRDLQYILDKKGITDDMLPKQERDAHNALEDARYIKKLWETVCQ